MLPHVFKSASSSLFSLLESFVRENADAMLMKAIAKNDINFFIIDF